MITFPQKTFTQFRQPIAPHPPQQTQTDRHYQHYYPHAPVQTAPPPVVQQSRNIPQQGQEHIPKGRTGVASMYELNSDLDKLKRQLKVLTERGKEFDRTLAEEKQGRARNNLSADNSLHRRQPQPIDNNHYKSPLQVPTVTYDSPTIRTEGTEVKLIPIRNPNKKDRSTLNLSLPNTQSPSLPNSNIQQEKLRELELQVYELKESNKGLQGQLQRSLLEIRDLKEELRKERSRVTIAERGQAVTEELKLQLQKQKQQYQGIVLQLRRKLDHEKEENRISIPAYSFDEALKEHLTQNQKLSAAMSEKEEELLTLRSELQEKEKDMRALKEDLRVREMRTGAEHRNKVQRLEMQLREQASQSASLRRTVEALNGRYKAALRQIQQKDDFMMKHLVQRGGPQPQLFQIVAGYKELLVKEGLLYDSIISDRASGGQSSKL